MWMCAVLIYLAILLLSSTETQIEEPSSGVIEGHDKLLSPLHVILNHRSLKLLLEKRNLWVNFANYRSSKLKVVRSKARSSLWNARNKY